MPLGNPQREAGTTVIVINDNRRQLRKFGRKKKKKKKKEGRRERECEGKLGMEMVQLTKRNSEWPLISQQDAAGCATWIIQPEVARLGFKEVTQSKSAVAGDCESDREYCLITIRRD